MKKTKNYYSVYGLVIETFIEFPELYPISATDKTDAVISLGMPPEWVIKEYKSGKYSNIQNNIMWFRLNDEMLVYAENGNNVIVWQIDDNINPIRLRSYILTGALTLIMLQRDYVLVHGSGLVHNNKAFIISGTSGSGKSTTALNLLDKSEILFATDDICAIKTTDSGCYLYPGPPFQKICPDVKNKNKSDRKEIYGIYYFVKEANKQKNSVLMERAIRCIMK